jgi:hypothetical protein
MPRPTSHMPIQRFPLRFARSYGWAARPFAITPATARVDLGEDRLDVRFGLWRVKTDLANITDVDVTGPYAFVKTAGPARLALTDRGLTFATNGDAGVRMRFDRPVPGLEPFGAIRHPELTVTVADVDGFAAALRSRVAAARQGHR